MNKNPKITTVYDIDAKRYHAENRKAIGAARAYVKEAKKTRVANEGVGKSFRGAASGIAVIDGPLGGISSRISSVNSLVSSGAAKWAGLGAAISGAAYMIGVSVVEFAQVERQQLQMQSLIKATGGAAGLSAKELDKFARSLAEDTLASPQGVREAINVMLTFKSVSGDTFKDSIRLSQDLASVMRTDVRSATQQLAKALEDPARNLTTLSRSGVTFTEVEIEKIKVMQESGDVVAAQTLILQKLEDQVGGAGAAEGGGLIGKTDLLSQRWGEFKEAIVAASNADGPVSTFLDNLAKGLDNINNKLNPSDQDVITGLHNEYVRLNEEIKKQEADLGGGTAFGGTKLWLEGLRAKREALKVEIKALQNARKDEIIAEQVEQQQLEKSAADYKQNLADDARKRREQQEAERAKRAQAKTQVENDRIVSLQQKKFDRISAAALVAAGDERAIEEARYAEQQAALAREFNLLSERGLLTRELKGQFADAELAAAQTHADAMGKIEQKEQEERVAAIKAGEEKIIDLRERFAQIREERFKETGNTAAAEQARYAREQSILRQRYELAAASASKEDRLALERDYLTAKADLHATHLERVKDAEFSFTDALAEQFNIRLDLAKIYAQGSIEQERQRSETTAAFFKEGLSAAAAQSSKWYKFQQAINIYETLQDTYSAAVGAYKSLVDVPYVGPVLAVGAAGTAMAFGKEKVDMIRNQPVPSFEGGGSTGTGPRVGGVDGRGGFDAVLHPDEFVVDLKKGSPMTPNIVINNAPAVESSSFDAQSNTTVINFAVAQSEQNFMQQMRRGGPMFDAMSAATGLRRQARR